MLYCSFHDVPVLDPARSRITRLGTALIPWPPTSQTVHHALARYVLFILTMHLPAGSI
ncbi:uncharacterized protein LAESUDRAFT_732951, partial [Laetiporus sulphureus 93-53]